MQLVHLTALELSYTPEPCNIFVKVRPVLYYTGVLQHNVHMYTLHTFMYFENPSYSLFFFFFFFKDDFVSILFPCSKMS